MTHLEAAGIVLLLIAAWSVYRANRTAGNNFDLLDMLRENGKVSKVACVFMGSWAALTYVFIGMYIAGKMTEGLFGLFGGITITPLIAKMFAPAPAPSTTTTTTLSSTEVK